MTIEQEPGTGTRVTSGRRFVSQITRNTFALVLEGERASSLHELTDWRSKPALVFGGSDWDANMNLVQVTPHLSLYDKIWPIWT